MELNVGDYVRTKYGKIGRIISFDKSICFDLENAKENIEDVTYKEEMLVVDTHYVYEDEEDMYFKDDIFKSSPNIIDLIEVGDYVNGAKVINISKEQGKNIEIYLDTKDLFEQNIYNNDDIKSIVTKEQFESMQYVVKED